MLRLMEGGLRRILPVCRWYDSRAREAVARVADWLQVPWSKVLLYECMLAQQSQVDSKSQPQILLSCPSLGHGLLEICFS